LSFIDPEVELDCLGQVLNTVHDWPSSCKVPVLNLPIISKCHEAFEEFVRTKLCCYVAGLPGAELNTPFPIYPGCTLSKTCIDVLISNTLANAMLRGL